MKKILFTLALLLIASNAVAVEPIDFSKSYAMIVSGRPAPGVAAGCTISSCSGATTCTGSTGCVVRETFNGCAANGSSGCDNTWSTSLGSPEYNYATSPAPLQGAQSLRLYNASGTVRAQITLPSSYDEVYVAILYRAPTMMTDVYPEPIAIMDSAETIIGNFTWYGLSSSSGVINAKIAGGSSGSDITVSSTTTYALKLRVKRKIGAAGAEAQGWYSTNMTSWTAAGSAVTDGTQTGTINKIYMYWRNGDMIVDDFRVSTSDINYW